MLPGASPMYAQAVWQLSDSTPAIPGNRLPWPWNQTTPTTPRGSGASSMRVAHEVVTEVAARPRNVVVLAPGAIPKTPSGELRRAKRSVAGYLSDPHGRRWRSVRYEPFRCQRWSTATGADDIHGQCDSSARPAPVGRRR